MANEPLPPPLLYWLLQRASQRSADSPAGGPVTFPTTDLVFRVRLAVGESYARPADVNADPLSWNWIEATRYVRFADGINTRTGKTAGSDLAQPGEMTLTLDNNASTDPDDPFPQAGRFARRNPNGPFFGLLSRNTPIWVEVDPGSGWVTLARMFVNEWPTRWSDKTGNDSTVGITCGGVLRRLGQSSEARSSLRRAITAVGVVAPDYYAPLEDGVTTTVPLAVFGLSPSVMSPLLVKFAAYTDALAAKTYPRIDLTRQAASEPAAGPGQPRLTAYVTTTGTGYLRVAFTFRGEVASPPLATMCTFDLVTDTAGNTLSTTFLVTRPDGPLGWAWEISADPGLSTDAVNPFDGEEHFIEIIYVQNGGNVDAQMWVDGALRDTVSTATTLAMPIKWNFYPNIGSLGETVNNTGAFAAISHVVIYTSASGPSLGTPGVAGKGETVNDRIVRLCAEDGIALTCTGATTSSPAMGPQPVAGIVDLLRDCEAVGQGLLYEAGFGVGYLTRAELENQSVALALDFNQRHIAEIPQPADDDRELRNRWTASRSSGSEFTHELTTGPMGTGTDGPGTWPDSVSVNVETDDLLRYQASWRVVRDTVDADRWPNIAPNLMDPATAPTLISALTSMPFGARVTIANPPAQTAPDTIDVTVDGRTQYLDPKQWRVSLVCFPNAANHTFRLAETSGDTDDFLGYLVFDTCVLAEDLDTTETGVDITSTGSLWSTDADDWTPGALVKVGGEVMRVTAVSGVANPQTLTVTRSINGVVKEHSAGAALEFASPGVLGL